MTQPQRLRIASLALAGVAAAWVAVAAGRPQNADAPAPSAASQPAASQPAAPLLDPNGAATAAGTRLMTGLMGSKHDFSRAGRDGRNLCLPCHTPHLRAAATPEYDQRTASAPPLRPFQAFDVELTGWSLLCLGCHDGVTAPDVYSSGHALRVVGQIGNARLGTRGLRSHPIGVLYPVGARDYNASVAVEAAGLPLPGGRIQCTTCHDAHNTHRIKGFLRMENDRSRMCLTCHRL